MKKEEIIYWRDRYDKEDKPKYKEIEKRLRKKFPKNKYITKQDLKDVIIWKFEESTKPWKKKHINTVEQIAESYIIKKSKKAFSYEDDEVRVCILKSIKSVGFAVTSVILSFYDSKNYGVFDFHAWKELYGKPKPDDLYDDIEILLEYFEKLREISAEMDLPCRDIEKAYFKKNLSE